MVWRMYHPKNKINNKIMSKFLFLGFENKEYNMH